MGQYYGVIQDPAVKVKVCDHYESFSVALACFESIVEDLEAERAVNPDVRGVINLSWGHNSTGCVGLYDSHLQESMSNALQSTFLLMTP